MINSFPPFPSPNPEASMMLPGDDISRTSYHHDSLRNSVSSASSSSSIPQSTHSAIDDDDLDAAHLPAIKPRSRRNSARKCVPSHTRIRAKQYSQSSAGPPSPTRSNSSGDGSPSSSPVPENDLDSSISSSVFLPDTRSSTRHDSMESSITSTRSSKPRRSSLRKSSAYEDSLRIGVGAWHPKKVRWGEDETNSPSVPPVPLLA